MRDLLAPPPGRNPLIDVVRCLRSFLATSTGYHLSSLRDAFPQTHLLLLFHTKMILFRLREHRGAVPARPWL